MEFKDVILEKIPTMSYTDLMEIQTAIEFSLNKDNIREKAIALIKNGQILQAVKWVKECTGWGLRESKEYVDSLRDALKNNSED
jgi:hypothetical protein